MSKSLLRTEILSKISRTRLLVYVGFIVLGIIVLIPQIDLLIDSLDVLKSADLVYVVLSGAMVLLTFTAAAAIYCALSFIPLRYPRTVLIQMAGMFANRLLPSGVGSIGVSFLYLKKAGHSIAQAASVVTINNSMGLLAHVLVVVALLGFNANAFYATSTPQVPVMALWILAILILVLILIAVLAKKFRARLLDALKQFLQQLVTYRHRKRRLGLALLAATALVVINVSSLLFAVLAVGGDISFVVALVVFTSGLVLGTLTPTPGGIGGAEAGLVAALVAYGTPISMAVAAAVLFRIFSYWFALVVGGIAFIIVDRRKYL